MLQFKKEKISGGLFRAGCFLVFATGTAIFAFLAWYAFRYTQYMPPNAPEIPVNRADGPLLNLLALLAAVFGTAGLMALEKRLSPRARKRVIAGAVFLLLLWLTFACFWWIHAAERTPGSDQFYICMNAELFSRGDYNSLRPGHYCDKYPQQLGIVAFLEVLFAVAGLHNYMAFETLNALAVVGTAWFGYQIVRELTDRMAAAVSYCVLMLFALPLIFYTSWVYGEILGIFFSTLTVALFLKYEKRRRWGYLAGSMLSLAAAVLIRKSCFILAIACCLTALLSVLRKWDTGIFVGAVCSIVIPCLAFAGIQQMYAMRSGIPKSEGLPTGSFLVMGLEESDGRYGWHTLEPTDVYEECDYDTGKANAVYMQRFWETWRAMWKHPSAAVDFFKQKQLQQWNEPLYQGFYFSRNYAPENPPDEDSFLRRLDEPQYFNLLLVICDKLQLVLYAGMLLYFLFAVRNRENGLPVLAHILPVMIIGGFLFSMVWEAKARYIVPYYAAMFPMAVIGYQQLWFGWKNSGLFSGK